MDIDSLTLPPEEPEEEPAVEPVVETPVVVKETPEVQEVPDVEGTLVAEEPSTAPADTTAPGLSYEDVTTPLTATQVADLVGADRRLISMVYRMAGKKGKEDTMAPYLLVRFVREEVLSDKRFSRMVPKADADRIHETGRQMDSVYAAGPVVAITDPAGLIAKADTVATVHPPLQDTSALVAVVPPAVPVPEPDPEPEYVPTPLEVLAEMAFTDARYPSREVFKALKGAGMDVTQEEIDLLYLYTASRLYPEKDYKMSVGELLSFVGDDLLADPSLANLVPEGASEEIAEAREMLSSGTDILRGEECSLALALTSYPGESARTHEFVGRLQEMVDRSLEGEHYLIGESVMYKELKDGFPRELLILTILTVVAIFIIVALTFKSLIIPVILILTVMSGVYVNVYACGAGGKSMLYLSYLIIQGLLMGATIDYSILFTGYYRNCRRIMGIRKSLAVTYYRTVNSILTSGLIITIVPFVMSHVVKDQLTASIMHSLSMGALAVILLILFVMPGVLAALDSLVVPKNQRYHCE
jgi:hypothetical protein